MTEDKYWEREEELGVFVGGIFLIIFLIISTIFLYMGEIVFSIVSLIMAGIFSLNVKDNKMDSITILRLLSIFTIAIAIILKMSWIVIFTIAVLWTILIVIQLITYNTITKKGG